MKIRKTPSTNTESKSERTALLREYFLNAYLLGLAKQAGASITQSFNRSKLDRLDEDFIPLTGKQ